MTRIVSPRAATSVALVALLHGAALWTLGQALRTPVQPPQPLEISVELAAELAPLPSPAPATAAASGVSLRVAQNKSASAPATKAPLPPATPTAGPTVAPNTANNTPPSTTTPKAASPAPDVQTSSATASQTNGPANSAPVGTASASTPNLHGSASAPPLTTAAVQLPSSDADYLNNPRPAYPPMSRRLGEQGTVIVRALIGTDGSAQKAEVQQSSGFERLDRAALDAALKWRYLPGKRAGVAEAMWFKLPMRFVLE